MSGSFDAPRLDRALSRLAQEFMRFSGDVPGGVEVLLVGGGAAMVTGLLAPERVTLDCDVMVVTPPEALHLLESAADRVGRELGLPSRWFNADVQIRRDLLPAGWRTRRVAVATWSGIRFHAASRIDLIAMKIVAGRDQDIEDLRAMVVDRHDESFLRSHFVRLEKSGTSPAIVRDARLLLAALLGEGPR